MLRTWSLVLSVLLGAAATARAHFADGMIFVVDFSNDAVHFVNQPNDWRWKTVLTSSDGLNGPGCIGFTAHGHMVVGNVNSDEIWEYDEDLGGTLVLSAADGLVGPFGGNALVIDGDGHLYVANRGGSEILRFDEDYTNGIVFADAADGLVQVTGMAFLANGDLLAVNGGSGGQVLLLDPLGNATVWDTIPGEDVAAIAVRANDDVYVACQSGNLYKIPDADPAQRFLLGTYGGSGPSLVFQPDQARLVHGNRGDGMLRTIHPDTGAFRVRIDLGWDAAALHIVGSQYSPGSYKEIGDGLAGAGGLVPELHGEGDPRLGGTADLEIHDFVGGALLLLVVGAGQSEVPFFGGNLYVDLSQWYRTQRLKAGGIPGNPGEGDADISFTIPSDPALIATRWTFQVLGLDPAAVQGVALTAGLQLYVGE